MTCAPPHGLSRALATATALTFAACGTGGRSPDASGVPVEFTIGDLSFHVAGGAATTGGSVLTLWLSDQPDTCLAITATPVQTAIFVSLAVAPAADGQNRATVVMGKVAPGPGEAIGRILETTGGTTNESLQASDGTVSWTVQADGRVTIDAIDVGFAAASGRLTTGGLTIPHC